MDKYIEYGNLGPISSSKILLHSIRNNIDNIDNLLTHYYDNKYANTEIEVYIDYISLLLDEIKQNIQYS